MLFVLSILYKHPLRERSLWVGFPCQGCISVGIWERLERENGLSPYSTVPGHLSINPIKSSDIHFLQNKLVLLFSNTLYLNNCNNFRLFYLQTNWESWRSYFSIGYYYFTTIRNENNKASINSNVIDSMNSLIILFSIVLNIFAQVFSSSSSFSISISIIVSNNNNNGQCYYF